MSGSDRSDRSDESPGGSGWTSTEQAARALGRSQRTIRRLVERGDLTGEMRQQGSRRALVVDVDSLQRLRDRMVAEGAMEAIVMEEVGESDNVDVGERRESRSSSLERAITNLFERTEERAVENGRLREQLAISERAESTRAEEIRRLEAHARTEAEMRQNRERELEESRAEANRLRQELEELEELEELKDRDEGGGGFWSRFFGV